MFENTVARLTDPSRRAVSVARAGFALGEDAVQQLRSVVRRVDGVLEDVQAMRQIAERLDERVADLQQQVDAFNSRLTHVESVLEMVAGDVEKATDRLPDPNDGTMHKIRSALSATSEGDERP